MLETSHPTIESTADKNDFSDDSMDPSPAVTSTYPLQITFKRPLPKAKIISAIQHTKEKRNKAIHICRELHRYSFRSVDKLQNLNTDKNRRIISKAMFIELRDYDPSNEYIVNYSDSKQ